MTDTLCATLTGLSLAAVPGGTSQAAVTDNDPSFEITAEDLRFILKQIKISESHPTDGDLLCAESTDTTGTCVPHPLLPWGLRTVDGRFNNLMPGQSTYGAADQPFPRVLDEFNRQAEPAPVGAPPNPPGATDVCDDPATTCYAQGGPGTFVYDADPRTISNLIVDQTTQNPAAIAATGGCARLRTDHGRPAVHPERVAGRGPLGTLQLVVHAVRPVLRPRPRPRRQGRERHGRDPLQADDDLYVRAAGPTS